MFPRPLIRRLPLLALTVLCLGHGQGGCGGHHPHTSPSGATCPPENRPTAQDFGRPFMENYCLSCHGASVQGKARKGAPENVNFDTLEDIRRQWKAIDSHSAAGPTATNMVMPPVYYEQPTLEERKRLGQWLACGAP
jgi:uncharacterized membrane protein